MLQFPLLVPGISREWFRGPDGNYLIATNGEKTSHRVNNLRVAGKDLVQKFGQSLFLFFNSNKKIKRFPGLTFKSVIQYKHFAEICEFELNSYGSELLIDYVQVCGKHVGGQTIPVQFERYYPLKETKIIISAPQYPLIKDDWVVISSKQYAKFINDQPYKDKKFYEDFVKRYNIGTNKPALLEEKTSQNLHDFFKKFFSFKPRYIDEAGFADFRADQSIYMDSTGIYIIANEFSSAGMDFESALAEFLGNCYENNFDIDEIEAEEKKAIAKDMEIIKQAMATYRNGDNKGKSQISKLSELDEKSSNSPTPADNQLIDGVEDSESTSNHEPDSAENSGEYAKAQRESNEK